ncbi:MAG: glucose-1-phosphate thymidylyltransferase [Spirochaetia bacterium]|nr:glucose-1-phosphate thymidylyltransferase [Spirochaetia bacterium]
MKSLLDDSFEKSLNPVFSLKPSFAYAAGIFSELQRLSLKDNSDLEIAINDADPKNQIRTRDFYKEFFHFRNLNFRLSFNTSKNNSLLTPDILLSSFPANLENDINLLKRELFSQRPANYEGDLQNIWIHNDAKVSNLCFINASKGSVVIDENAEISAFCILNGPLYIGAGSILDRVSISHTRIGRECRMGGEISDCIIGDFTNKHHEGFLGHSIAGDWINLGALTTTSDLKNNYGKIRLEYHKQDFETHRIKFGSILGDFVKTGIGTMLNTGTIVDTGALLFLGCPLQKYYPPFFWGGAIPEKYLLDRFLEDIKKIMARRNQAPDIFLLNQISLLHKI